MRYTKGLLWFVWSDASVPLAIQQEMRTWGLCRDEFVDTAHFPSQLYVREARRLVGDAVFNENTARNHTSFGNASIGLHGYNFDSHNTQRFVCPPNTLHCNPPPHTGATAGEGTSSSGFYVLNEGDVEVNPGVGCIPYSAVLPRRAELTNLLVPVCASSSHIGYSTLRLEPQYMIMGHSTGVAAALFLASPHLKAVHDIDLAHLNRLLLEQKQRLTPNN